MSTIALICAGVLFIGVFILILDELSFGSPDFADVFSAFFVTSLILSVIICTIVLFSYPRKAYPCEPIAQELIQAGNSSKTEGSIFFFSGYVDEKAVYRYFYKDGENIRQNYLYADTYNTVICETLAPPYVMVYTKTKPAKWGLWRKFIFGKKPIMEDDGHHGILYVPKGTIIPNKFDNLNL